MKPGVLLIVLGSLYFSVSAQSPGGVKGAVAWYHADTASTTSLLNFHPALVLDGKQSLSIQLGDRDWRNASFFTVYQATDTAHENSIWHTILNGTTSLVLTTDRMADLRMRRYMNYHDVIRQQPKVNVYVQQKEKDSGAIGQQSWVIGVQPVTPRVPVNNFTGLLPELVVYDRALNSTERLKVASYLALKYGVTLTEPGATYLNSAGQTIWQGHDHPKWHNNIAGIGRDDSSGLLQYRACSSNTPGLLTISTTDSLINNSFLLWGDNGKPLIPSTKIPGQPVTLQRTWLMKPSGVFNTAFLINTKMVDAPMPVQPVFWLAINRPDTTEFIKMDALDKQGMALFKNISWDKEAVWGLVVAQDLLVQTIIDQPTCAANSTGQLQVRIQGGKAPFRLFLNSRQIGTIVPGLAAGKYFLTVTDANQQRFIDSFYINHEDLPPVTGGQYTLPAGGDLLLNAGKGMPSGLTWEWNGPEHFQSFNPQVRISKPGLYTLRCGKNGCFNQQDILVKANALFDITVFPNPSTGRFAARVTLDVPAPVTMDVYDPDGRLISRQQQDRRYNHLFTDELKNGGVYELVFTSGLSRSVKRLVIVK